MSKLTCFTNGKVSNKALNLLANTAGMVATAIAITTTAAVFTPSAKAYDLHQDSYSRDIWDRPTYNNGAYTRLDNDDFGSSFIHEDTLQDRDGNRYGCDWIGNCSRL